MVTAQQEIASHVLLRLPQGTTSVGSGKLLFDNTIAFSAVYVLVKT